MRGFFARLNIYTIIFLILQGLMNLFLILFIYFAIESKGS